MDKSEAGLKSSDEDIKYVFFKIKKYVKYLISKWLVLIVFVLLGGFLGGSYSYLKGVKYLASTSFVLESGDGKGGLNNYAGIASMMGLDLGFSSGGIFQGDNILELYKSHSMIEKALLQPLSKEGSILLIEKYLDFNDRYHEWEKKSPELLKIDFKHETQVNPILQRMRDSIFDKTIRNINEKYLNVYKPDKKLSIIKVEVKSNNEVFSSEFNRALVATVNDFFVQTKTKKSKDNIGILQSKVDSVRFVLNNNISTVASVVDGTPNLNPTKQAQRIIPTQKSQMSAEVNRLILSELVKNLELSKIALMKESPLIQVVDEPQYPLYKEKSSLLVFSVLGALTAFLFTAVVLILNKTITEFY